jgi:glycosyltransferase involved in cell wall biosynthesis
MVSTLPTAELSTLRPRVFDIDDAVFLGQRFGAVDRIARRSDVVICGNAWLANHFTVHPDVVVLPTAVDTDRYNVGQGLASEGDELVTVGWMGTSSNLHELDDIAASIERMLALRPAVRFVVVSDAPDRWSLAGHERVEARQWSAADEVNQLQRFDIGLMPLRDTAWTRGKCGYKLLTYLACGVSAVASPVGVNSEILGHDHCVLPGTPDAWVEAVLGLVDDAGARAQRAEAGRRRVEEHYSVRAVLPDLAALLHRAAGRSTAV